MSNINDKFMKNDLNITDDQKQEAIKKEEHYRKLYYSIFDLNSTREFKQLASELINGFDKMNKEYGQAGKDKNDVKFIIKFAFRDFFLLIFINMKNFFDNNEFLKDLHKQVYLSDNYVNMEQFESLVDYCKEYLKNNESK